MGKPIKECWAEVAKEDFNEDFGDCEYGPQVHIMEDYPGMYTYYCDKHWQEFLESID